jgi:cell division protein FtsN
MGAQQTDTQQVETQQANAQQPAMTEPEVEAEQPPVVKEVEPDQVPVKQKVKTAKKPAAKKQPAVETVENVEQADYSDANAAGPEPLVLVPPGQPVASGVEQTQPQPEQQQPAQKSRSFFDFGTKSEGAAQKRTGKAAEQIGLNNSETAVNTNYANARQPKAAEDQVASLAPEPEAQQPIPEPEPQAQQSAPEPQNQLQQNAPEPKKQPQQAAISGYIAQLASFRSEAEALAEYDRMRSRHGSLLNGLAPRVSKAFVSGSHRYRLGVGPLPSRAEASKLCSNLIAAGERDCLVRAN